MNVNPIELWYRICQSLDHLQCIPDGSLPAEMTADIKSYLPQLQHERLLIQQMPLHPQMFALQGGSPSLELYVKAASLWGG